MIYYPPRVRAQAVIEIPLEETKAGDWIEHQPWGITIVDSNKDQGIDQAKPQEQSESKIQIIVQYQDMLDTSGVPVLRTQTTLAGMTEAEEVEEALLNPDESTNKENLLLLRTRISGHLATTAISESQHFTRVLKNQTDRPWVRFAARPKQYDSDDPRSNDPSFGPFGRSLEDYNYDLHYDGQMSPCDWPAEDFARFQHEADSSSFKERESYSIETRRENFPGELDPPYYERPFTRTNLELVHETRTNQFGTKKLSRQNLSPQVLATSNYVAGCTGKYVFKSLLDFGGSHSMINHRCLPKGAVLWPLQNGHYITTDGTFDSSPKIEI
jgi:hypothetical protein